MPTMWAVTADNHTYILWRGVIIWKRWDFGGCSSLFDVNPSRRWHLSEAEPGPRPEARGDHPCPECRDTEYNEETVRATRDALEGRGLAPC